MREVEVIKIGEITGRLNSSNPINPYLIVRSDGGELCSYYLDIFLNEMKCEFELNNIKVIKSQGIIQNNSINDILKGKFSSGESRFGTEVSNPVVGETYKLIDGWRTSLVERVVDDCILITMNSIYAIHCKQEFRDKKLNDLGI